MPAGLVAVAAVVVLWRFGVPAWEVGAFAGYVGFGVMLPGLLLWRALGPGGGSLPADMAAGLAVGYAVEVLVYIAARAAGAPLAVLAWPVATIVVFAVVPGLRRHWRGCGVRVPVGWAWAMSGVVGYLLAWSAQQFYRVHGLSWPGNAGPYVDMSYHLALLGEIKHHVPPTFPAVLGERLSYHWFVYAEMAATSWVTGIEPQTLLYRLTALPMLAGIVVLVAAVAWRLTGRPWVGVAAILVTCFACSPALHQGSLDLFTTRSLFTAWLSPTQNFGTLLFAPVVLLLIAFLRSERGRWWAMPILLLALAGAKATFLPMLLGGLVLVLGVHALARRRLHRAALTAGLTTLACLLAAQFVLFGGGAQGMTISPMDIIRRVWELAADPVDGLETEAAPGLVLGLAALYLTCLACVWAGLAGLAARRVTPLEPAGPSAAGRRAALLDPAVLLLLGIGAAGVGAMLMLGHPAASQLYFLEGARPYLSIAAVAGGLALVRAYSTWWAVGAAALGAALAAAVTAVLGPEVPMPDQRLLPLVLPYLVLGLATVAVWLVLAWRRGPVALVLVALVSGYALPSTAVKVIQPLGPPGQFTPTLPEGGMEAGRWLRKHSRPDDVVATNAHCRPVRTYCDSRHYWVSGYSERRVLVEGWAYAESTLSRAPLTEESYLSLGFADPDRLAVNDAAFMAPSAENIERLIRTYGVKWLFVDESQNIPSPALERFARLRFRSGACSVYEL
ncbi:hypothetical protein [Nonomuraea sp. LPB2021202275-12-8]|uniref:hypothetical protein n=1 Tax=Nonomuraea sp. LPB2021202275-12-8 TaxID=3120159 RepID=UPI00300CBA6B